LRARAAVLLTFVGLMWVIELIDVLFLRGALDQLGIRPRETRSLWGIVLAPFLHGGLRHLIANTAPLLILGWLVLVRRRVDFALVTIVVTLIGGLGVWLFAPPFTIHIGASGVVFGYATYLIARGVFNRSPVELAMGGVVGLIWGGVLLGGLVPREGISWQGHLFGAIGGVVAARVLASRRDSARPSPG
jgi:membrane associated rhomboid family serine protease